jgi:hypothetical protein
VLSAYAVDGLFYQAEARGRCACAACQHAFHAASGLALPLREDSDSPAWRAYVRFRYDQVAAFAARLRAFLHARQSQAILAVGLRLSDDDSGRLREAGWRGPQLAEAADVLILSAPNFLERPQPRYYLWAGEQARQARTLRALPPTVVMLSYSGLLATPHTAQPPAQLAYDIMQVAAHGAQPGVAFAGALDQEDRRALPAVAEVFSYLRDHAASYDDLRSPARIALLYSQATLDLASPNEAAQRALAEFRGFCEMLVEAHLPCDVLHEGSLDEAALARYDLLLLPNVADLSDAQAARLDRWVEDGGHLLASACTSLYDDQGQRRATFALVSLGRTLVAERDGTGATLRVHSRTLLPSLAATDVIPLGGTFLVTTAAWEESPPDYDLAFIPPASAAGGREEATNAPGLIITPFGRGETAYLPWPVGRLYHELGAPEYRLILRDLVARWIRPLLSTDAPGSVEVTLHHPHGERRHALVHLLNATGWQSKPLTEVIPLRDLSVWVRGDYAAARELRSGAALPLTREGEGVRFTVPVTGTFAAVELVGEGFAFPPEP